MTEAFHFRPPAADEVPLLVSIPHTGIELPAGFGRRLASHEVATLPDTDWHLHRLYDFVPELGGRTLFARYSRYLVDLNRAPDDRPLYPGRFETTLVPTRTFDDTPVYAAGEEPDAAEVEERRGRYWRPYHARLASELAALRERHGIALLFEAHSIRSEVPALFEGVLPDLVLGDAGGRSAEPRFADAVAGALTSSRLTVSRNAPFRGGFITREYGDPPGGIHALQLEMRQALYMEEDAPYRYDEERARELRVHLRAALEAFVAAIG